LSVSDDDEVVVEYAPPVQKHQQPVQRLRQQQQQQQQQPVARQQQQRVAAPPPPSIIAPARDLCGLCPQRVVPAEQGFAQLECGHVYHVRCLLLTGRAYCPLCIRQRSALGPQPAPPRPGDLLPVDFGDDAGAAAMLRTAEHASSVANRDVHASDVVRMTLELHSAQEAMRRARSAADAAAQTKPGLLSRFFSRQQQQQQQQTGSGGAAAGADSDVLWLRDMARPTLVVPVPRGGPSVALTLSGEQFDMLVRHASVRELLDVGLDAHALLSDDRISARLLIGDMRYTIGELRVLGFTWVHLRGRLQLDAALLRERRADALRPAELVADFGVTFGVLLNVVCSGNIDTFVSLKYAADEYVLLGATAPVLAAAGLRLQHLSSAPFNTLSFERWRSELKLASLETLRAMQLTPHQICSAPLSWTKEQLCAAFGDDEWLRFKQQHFAEKQRSAAKQTAATVTTKK
jgi:hypothetical protein